MRWRLTALAISLTFSACSGPDADLPPPYRHLEVPEERLRASDAIARGQALYETNCLLCHGERGDGRGRRGSGFARKPPRFDDPAWRRSTTARRAYFVVREGLAGTPMPGWRWLSEGETWDVVAYILALAEGPSRGERSLAPATP